MSSTTLTPEEIDALSSTLPDWGMDSDVGCISRTFSFENFKQSIAFVNKVADLAEKQDHHPDIMIDYDTVTLVLTTHSAGGLTEKDFTLASAIDRLS